MYRGPVGSANVTTRVTLLHNRIHTLIGFQAQGHPFYHKHIHKQKCKLTVVHEVVIVTGLGSITQNP